MPCHEVVTAALVRDMRELRGMISRMQVVYHETSRQGQRVTRQQDKH